MRLLLGAAAFVVLSLFTAPAADAQARRCEDGCTSPEFPHCCGGVCTNRLLDEGNCGACGLRCGPGQTCRDGICTAIEPQGPVCAPPCGPGRVCLVGLPDNVCCDSANACLNTCYGSPPNHCENQAGLRWCCAADQGCCQGHCCDPGSSCMPASSDPESGNPCCPNARVCGAECCFGDTECVGGRCRPRCSPACAPGENCIGPGDPVSGAPPTCCPAGQTWDVQSVSLCCVPENRWLAAVGQVTVPECCPPAERWREGGQCCPAERRPDPRFNCCQPGTLAAVASVDPAGKICCPEERECNGVCCDYFENCINGACRPEPDACEPCGADGACCDEGERCVDQACVSSTLSGIWMDEAAGVPVRIVTSGASVTATYLEPRPCEHGDGTGAVTMRDLNFAGTVAGNRIDGELGTCKFGSADAGPTRSPLELAITDGGFAMSGRWWNGVEGRWEPITYRKVRDEPAPAVGEGPRPRVTSRMHTSGGHRNRTGISKPRSIPTPRETWSGVPRWSLRPPA